MNRFIHLFLAGLLVLATACAGPLADTTSRPLSAADTDDSTTAPMDDLDRDDLDRPDEQARLEPDPSETPTTELTARDAGEPTSIPLDIGVRHPNGSQASISSVRYEPTLIVLDIEVINGSASEITLVYGPTQSRRMRLVDDLGNIYDLQPPGDDADFNIEPGEILGGQLAFLGPVVNGATELALAINASDDDVASGESTPAGPLSSFQPRLVLGPIPTAMQ
jgi:hypothetical protein